MNNLLEFRKKYLYHINLYINTKCNLICEYCYARKNFEWNKEVPLNKILNVLEKINIHLPNSFVSFIGGEPTIYPNFKNLLKKIIDYNLTFHFYTNGTKNLSNILNFRNSNKINITMSLHHILIKKINSNYLKIFKENIIFLLENNFNFNLTFVFFNDKKFIQYFNELYKIVPHKNIYISFIHDYFNDKELIKYKDNYESFINNYKVNIYNFKKSKKKKCFYNEFNIFYNKIPYIEINSCLKKFITDRLQYVNDKIILNKKNLEILKKKKDFIICEKDCPFDPAFYNSWESIE